MAEKARMQINVNKTKLDTNACSWQKVAKKKDFKLFKSKHDLEVTNIQSKTKNVKSDIKTTKADINETTNKVDSSFNKSQDLNKIVQDMDTQNQTAKIQLSEYQRRIVELNRQKTTSESQIHEKTTVRNLKISNTVKNLTTHLKNISEDYQKKIAISRDNLEDCRESLVRAEVEKTNLEELKLEWEESLKLKREELDKVANFMAGIRDSTDGIKVSLDKKRRAIMRIRNENDGISTRCFRTVF